MTVGRATRATSADKADLAEKASQDSNGANIANTYAVITGNYQSMTVGKSSESDNVSKNINGKDIGSIFESDGITVKNATNAQYAKYASDDISKGTIEERLTNMGFKQGVVEIVNKYNSTISVNSLKKQGKLVLFDFKFDGDYIKGKIPQEFMPKDCEMNIYGRENAAKNPGLAIAAIDAEGNISFNGLMGGYLNGVFEHIGWETK